MGLNNEHASFLAGKIQREIFKELKERINSDANALNKPEAATAIKKIIKAELK